MGAPFDRCRFGASCWYMIREGQEENRRATDPLLTTDTRRNHELVDSGNDRIVITVPSLPVPVPALYGIVTLP
jgi:hypothetical protein